MVNLGGGLRGVPRPFSKIWDRTLDLTSDRTRGTPGTRNLRAPQERTRDQGRDLVLETTGYSACEQTENITFPSPSYVGSKKCSRNIIGCPGINQTKLTNARDSLGFLNDKIIVNSCILLPVILQCLILNLCTARCNYF